MAAETTERDPAAVRAAVSAMAQQAVDMLRLTWEGWKKQDETLLQEAGRLGRELHQQEKQLTAQLLQPGSDTPAELTLVPLHLERIGDNVELLVRAVRGAVHDGVLFTERARRELHTLFEKACELLECVRDAIRTGNRVLIRYVRDEAQRYEALVNAYALSHQQRLVEGVCMPRASSIYVALLDDFKSLVWHAGQIADKLAAPASAAGAQGGEEGG
ncbi:MAG: hypothetical protein KatS3mg131_3881 [Candidatus Tectimicrobiota bacterium]|nr:MAG: hypothetical protein KatS3mg131_3881 [Candidatus Tectomicrobia bacterium]